MTPSPTGEGNLNSHLPYKSQFIFSCHPEGSLCELNLSRSSCASTERPFAKFANRIPRDKSHGARPMRVSANKTAPRSEGAPRGTIFAYEIARERQSSFSQKCEPDSAHFVRRAGCASCVARPIRKAPIKGHPEGSLRELNLSRSSCASTERPFAKFANRIPRDKSHGARPMRVSANKTAPRSEGAPRGTIFAYEIARERQSSFSQKCGPGIEVLQTFALPLGHGVFCTM